jgi:hypothetical protein
VKFTVDAVSKEDWRQMLNDKQKVCTFTFVATFRANQKIYKREQQLNKKPSLYRKRQLLNITDEMHRTSPIVFQGCTPDTYELIGGFSELNDMARSKFDMAPQC